MTYRFTLLTTGLFLAGAMIGCGGGKAAPGTAAPSAAGASALREQDMPSVPKDAQWTIFCYAVTGPDHIVLARRMRNDLMQASELRDWHVIHGDSESTLYHGFYRTMDDPRDRDTARARRDRERIRAFTDARGDRVFRHAHFVSLDLPDEDGLPEWDLQNAEGFWSLEIAVYRDSRERKRFAAEAVRAARQMGVEAYYYHGPTASSICIGAWPEEAIRAQEAAVAQTPRNPSRPIAIVPPGMNVPRDLRDAHGNPVEVFTPRLEPVDPSLIATMKQYTSYSVNGEEVGRRVRDPQTGESRFVPQPTVVIQIPRRPPSMLSGPSPTAPEQPQHGVRPPAQTSPTTPPPARPSPTGGRLRSIDD